MEKLVTGTLLAILLALGVISYKVVIIEKTVTGLSDYVFSFEIIEE